MGYDYWVHGEKPIDTGLPLRFEKSHQGRTPLGTKPPSQIFNRIVRTENEKRAFDKKVAKRLAKKGKKV